MLKIEHNISLKNLNTFGIEAKAKYFVHLKTQEDINDLTTEFNSLKKPIFILGSGANTLFTGDYQGTVIYINTNGIEVLENKNDDVLIEVQAGEIWDNLVDFCIKNNYYGLENLVAIPSTVGASAIQNIGAYGMEAKDSIFSVKYIDLNKLTTVEINNNDCKFTYRNSIFKNELKNKIIITSVKFKLKKNASLNLSYGNIKLELKKLGVEHPSIKQLTDAIRSIRNSKLPDPKLIGNAGSFFKNPIISNDKLQLLKNNFPDIVYYQYNDHKSKIAAGWLIEYCQLKGLQIGGAAVHMNQALVIINKNNASSSDIVRLSKLIQEKIYSTFHINILPEVIFI